MEPTESMTHKAWVVTWTHHIDIPWPSVSGREPLAVLPGHMEPEQVEAAMVAVHQLVCQSDPSRLAEVLNSMAYEVEWISPATYARIGHEPQVFAEYADVTYSPDPLPDGTISYVDSR